MMVSPRAGFPTSNAAAPTAHVVCTSWRYASDDSRAGDTTHIANAEIVERALDFRRRSLFLKRKLRFAMDRATKLDELVEHALVHERKRALLRHVRGVRSSSSRTVMSSI